MAKYIIRTAYYVAWSGLVVVVVVGNLNRSLGNREKQPRGSRQLKRNSEEDKKMVAKEKGKKTFEIYSAAIARDRTRQRELNLQSRNRELNLRE